MKSNKDYIKEEEFAKIEKLIEDTEIKALIGSDEYAEYDDVVSGDEIPDVKETVFPGSLELKMDPMKMNLYMELKAPVNCDNSISIDDVKRKIRKFGSYCISRVDWEYLREIYIRIMHDGEIISSVIIARGKRVKSNVPEHIIIKDSLNVDFKPEVLEGDKVNFHHIKSFLTVEKGEFIGDIIPELPGVPGRTLLGKEIPPPREVVNNFVPGDNTFINAGKLYSAIEGTFKIVKNNIEIDPCLTIPTDIDYRTGDIEFKGDIYLEKSVREGFSVCSGRDLLVNESLEPADIICKNNLYVKYGIVGSEKYSITCGGDVNALHLENATVKARGSIHIEKSSTKSNLYCLDKLIMGEKASIIGGQYHIQNGIVVGNIGNKMEVESYIVIGIDYEVEEKLKKIQKSSLDIVSEMNRLQESLRHIQEREERDKVKYLFLSLKNRINSLNNYSRSLLTKLDKNDRSTIIAYGTVYPGTYIEICHISCLVDQELTRVKFSLDKGAGKIKWDYL